ncbi:MAG: GNAT family N-acetyltransferase [Spirochaetaceae bacterium]|nr:GNAT family N-acetyltransferase [Spirochaetaceae bacterium]
MAALQVRELQACDLGNGFFATLDALRPTGDVDADAAAAIFEQVRRNPDTVVAVAELDGRIVGTGTLYLLRKFLYGGSTAAHIEDVAVAADRQRAGVGRAVIEYLLGRAEAAGCYKTVLYCEDDVLPFYRRLGFRHTTNGMRFDHAPAPAREGT